MTHEDGGVMEFAYDKAGGLTNDGESIFRYDRQSRLTSKSGKNGTSTFRYDNDGNLVRETYKGGTKPHKKLAEKDIMCFSFNLK